ncbi:MAG: hypothetical protein HOO99_04050 [Hyphomicrobiaceae bacterium]|nr:hypothetical protein [Hyphomicrobiaceae bacterium]
MSNSKILTSIAEVVKAFGGTTGMAEWAGIGLPAVSNWIAKGQIPPGWHFRLDKEAQRRGYTIDPCVFDDRLPAPQRLPNRKPGGLRAVG